MKPATPAVLPWRPADSRCKQSVPLPAAHYNGLCLQEHVQRRPQFTVNFSSSGTVHNSIAQSGRLALGEHRARPCVCTPYRALQCSIHNGNSHNTAYCASDATMRHSPWQK
eukprot:jgi/Ulvmu1/6635/UM003_0273.1